MRIILHVDLDAFYAACEEREKPELKGRPVVVGADPKKGRGVVATANYEARKYGVRSGMPISKAYSLCPHGEFLRPNFELYVSVSEKIMEILRKYSRPVEQVSVDEAYIDASEIAKNYKEAESAARGIKDEIRQKEGLTCSIGVGPNKLIAKIASDYRKPDGLTVVENSKTAEFLSGLPVGKIPGVGRKTAPMLNDMGIRTIGELAACSVPKLAEYFGKFGILMHEYARGIDSGPVSDRWETKSVGKEVTFEKDTRDKNDAENAIILMSKTIHDEISEQCWAFKTVAVKIRYSNFETLTRQTSLPRYSSDCAAISENAIRLFSSAYNGRPLRLVGVRVSQILSTRQQKGIREFV